jgi:hypothetical protein
MRDLALVDSFGGTDADNDDILLKLLKIMRLIKIY